MVYEGKPSATRLLGRPTLHGQSSDRPEENGKIRQWLVRSGMTSSG